MEKRETQPRPKKRYAAPRLTIHGSVEKITRDLGGQPTDGVLGSTQVT